MAVKQSEDSALETVRKAILDVLGKYINEDRKRAWEIIVESTTTGPEDRGGWAPEAAVIIYTEGGVPSGLYETPAVFEGWFKVNERIGYDRFLVEHYNAAVIAVYNQ